MDNLTNDLQADAELEALENFLEEEFNPDLFYTALSNALDQLESLQRAEAA